MLYVFLFIRGLLALVKYEVDLQIITLQRIDPHAQIFAVWGFEHALQFSVLLTHYSACLFRDPSYLRTDIRFCDHLYSIMKRLLGGSIGLLYITHNFIFFLYNFLFNNSFLHSFLYNARSPISLGLAFMASLYRKCSLELMKCEEICKFEYLALKGVTLIIRLLIECYYLLTDLISAYLVISGYFSVILLPTQPSLGTLTVTSKKTVGSLTKYRHTKYL